MTTDPRSPDITLDAPWTPETVDWTGSISLEAGPDQPHFLVLQAKDDPDQTMRCPMEYDAAESLAAMAAALGSGNCQYEMLAVDQPGTIAHVLVKLDGSVLAHAKVLADQGGDQAQEFTTDSEGWTSSRAYEVKCGNQETGKLSYKFTSAGVLNRWQHKLADGTVAAEVQYTVPGQN